jgi:hypothetical protein
MSSKNLVASPEDYVKFKKFLQFFVWQSSKNADNGEAEGPTRNKKGKGLKLDNPEFASHYGLDPRFSKMAGLDFIIRFFMCGRFNSEFSTYINIGLLNIVGKFENGKIVALKNLIRLDIPNTSIRGELRIRCDERNNKLNYYSLKDLDIVQNCQSGNISESLKSIKAPDDKDKLKEMFDEYLENHNKFFEEIEQSLP